MKGDFSKWKRGAGCNLNGVLHQQGRVLLDSDWNDQARIAIDWRDKAGRDIIGHNVAGVPASARNGFKVINAKRTDGGESPVAELTIRPGLIWVDGLLSCLKDGEFERADKHTGIRDMKIPEETPDPCMTFDEYPDVIRLAGYMEPPSPEAPGAILKREGIREAVILEVWREALNGFQVPDHLIEPALGGPDTTERIHTAMAFKLLRLQPGEYCDDIVGRLSDDCTKKGRLTVTLDEPLETPEPCPQKAGGGYTGFEHNLYRIEIANVNRVKDTWFKYSQFNGTPVGRGTFKQDGSNKTVEITANDQPIKTCGLTEFYMEIVEYNQGRWRITYGAEVSLDKDELKVTTERYVESSIPTGDVFFRLWNGIRPISEFSSRKELRDGINLEFPTGPSAYFRPGDYWTFSVRAGLIENSITLIDKMPPEGIEYHRVPLAILNWGLDDEISSEAGQIEDCRRVFPSLTDVPLDHCCIPVRPDENLYRIMEKIKDKGGGCICLLPGDHYLQRELDFSGCSNISICGSGMASRLHVSRSMANMSPFILKNARHIVFDSFAIFSDGQKPIWVCQDAQDIEIKGMVARLMPGRNNVPLIYSEGNQCQGWRLTDNTFIGSTGLLGQALYQSAVSGNLWFGANKGIDLQNTMNVEFERNWWIGLKKEYVETGTGLFEKIARSKDARERVNTVYSILNNLFSNTQKLSIQPQGNLVNSEYAAVNISNAVDTNFTDNLMIAGIGIDIEFIDNCEVRGNRFLTMITGAEFGLAHGIRFLENRIGAEDNKAGGSNVVFCQVGLRILSDAIDCKILDNMFVKTKKGIIFESDHDGHLALIHDVSHSLLINPNIAGVEAKRLYEDAQDRIRERFKRKQLVGSGFFRLGKSERLLIQGNFLNCDEVGIEWSGTKKIIDFRIKDNDFIGCQDIAIQIEPDDRTMLLAEPVDTKVRLIENNRFNINTGAVRATIGSVRVEKNDIRVMSPELGFIPWEGVLIAAGDYVYRDNSLSEAAGESNFPGVRVEFKMASNTVKKNVSKIDSRNLSRELGEKILASHPPAKGDSGADLVHTAKILAEINALDSLAVLLDRKIPQVVNDLEGFAINLAGHRNRVIHNHIYSDNNRVFGGIVFHLLSGEVRDNEVCVPRLALLMNGKIAKSSSIDRVAEIVGNSLKVSGIQAAGGKTIPVYALSIPSLNLGNLSIMRNIFEGSVKIGSDPISSLGFFKKDKVEFEKIDAFYHEVTLDSGSFNMSIMAGMLSKAITPALMPNPELFIARPINLDILHIAEVVDIEYVKPIEDVVETVIPDPHLDKTVLQFADNRVIRGWLSISPNVAGSSLSIKDPQKPSGRALNIALSNNVIDLTAKVAGYDLIIVGNHSQNRIQYNADNYVAKNANIPPLS